MVIRLAQPIENFLAELRREFDHEAEEAFRDFFESVEREADRCSEHLKYSQALGWICAQRRPLRERLDAIDLLVNAPRGYLTVKVARPA